MTREREGVHPLEVCARRDARLQPVARSGTAATPEAGDQLIAAYLQGAETNPPAAWAGSYLVHREHAPAYFQYPAMMSPAVQRDLLRLILRVAPDSASVMDPFCGSGTVLSEAMYQGLECWVSDVNPLAVLLCQVKAGAYAPDRFERLLRSLLSRVAADCSRAISTDLPDWRKWFRATAAQQLSKLRRSIRRVTDLEARRFFWACLAETVRLTSNSRTSTYKLHVRADDEIARIPLPIAVFNVVAKSNVEKHRQVAALLREQGCLSDERYSKDVSVRWHDAADGFTRTFDILMTSPPYGDNVSTVPYGQSAYLPLHWIDIEDIDSGAAQAGLVRSTYEIDRVSLGGQRPRWKEIESLHALRERSPSLDGILGRLATEPPDRTTRVLAFIRDLERVLPKLLSAVRVNGYLVWTVGNRRVGGCEIPLSEILQELLSDRSAVLVGRCKRRIPQKRMAFRNSISPTMKDEHLLVFRRLAVKSVPNG